MQVHTKELVKTPEKNMYSPESKIHKKDTADKQIKTTNSKNNINFSLDKKNLQA